jgi:hypothetical protein
MRILFTPRNNSTLAFLTITLQKKLWRMVQITFYIDIPISMRHMFNNSANRVGNHLRSLLS